MVRNIVTKHSFAARHLPLVHFAADAAQANAICVDIARRSNCKLCVKSKSMVTEEIELNAALEAAGIEVTETDLGEFVVQLSGDRPSHIIAPAIHKTRAQVGRLFAAKLGIPYTDDPPTLTRAARISTASRGRPSRQNSRSQGGTRSCNAGRISRSAELDQKHRTRYRRNARRASRTRTMSRAVAGSNRRRLFLPPLRPISARYALISFMLLS
mgnify:CR=1 FL=1